jgi:hypothetical protein
VGSRVGAISFALLAFALSACGGSGSHSSVASRHTAHTKPASAPASASTLPSRDANGYVEGPRTYTDDGVRVTLSSSQAANPITSSEDVLTLGVVDRADVDQPFTSQSQITEADMAQYTIRIGASGLNFRSSSVITCSAEPVAAGSVWEAQSCDTPSGTVINEIYDPATKVEAWSGYWNLISIYQTTVGVLTGIYKPPSHSGTATPSGTAPGASGGAWDEATAGGQLCSAPLNPHTSGSHDTSDLRVLGTTCAAGAAIVEALYRAEAAPYPASCAQGLAQGPEIGACSLSSSRSCIPVEAPGEARLDIECDDTRGTEHVTFVEWEYAPPTSAQTTPPPPTDSAASCALGSLGGEYKLVSSTVACVTAVHLITGYHTPFVGTLLRSSSGALVIGSSGGPVRELYGWQCQGGVNAPVTCVAGPQRIVFAYQSSG